MDRHQCSSHTINVLPNHINLLSDRDMGARHRARAHSIQIMKVQVIAANKCRRPAIKQFHVSIHKPIQVSLDWVLVLFKVSPSSLLKATFLYWGSASSAHLVFYLPGYDEQNLSPPHFLHSCINNYTKDFYDFFRFYTSVLSKQYNKMQ